MREIDLNSWPRRPHYEFFRTFQSPFFDVAARVDLTPLVLFARSQGSGLFTPMLHTVTRAANQTPALRLRFKGDKVFEVPTCNPSFTFIGDNQLFNYATAPFDEDLEVFSQNVQAAIEKTRKRTDLNLDNDRFLSLIYITSLPWVDFQSISHAFSGDPDDCFPRIAWGKITDQSTTDTPRFETTVQITAHHALVDGSHIGEFFQALEQNIQSLPTF